jgi:hypothetical protein
MRAAVAYVCVHDIAATWELYEQVAAAMAGPAPRGSILHVAGPTDEGIRVIDVWENEQAWQELRTDRLAPVLAGLGGPARPEPIFRDLRPAHVVVGDRIGDRENW